MQQWGTEKEKRKACLQHVDRNGEEEIQKKWCRVEGRWDKGGRVEDHPHQEVIFREPTKATFPHTHHGQSANQIALIYEPSSLKQLLHLWLSKAYGKQAGTPLSL